MSALLFLASPAAAQHGCFEGRAIFALPGGSPVALVEADLDGDGILDLVMGDLATNSLLVALGLGGGNFGTVASYPTSSWPGAITVGDLDQDGDLDVAVAIKNANQLELFLNDGTGSFPPPILLPGVPSPVTIASGDLDGDGRVDLVVTNDGVPPNNSTVSVLRSLGGGSFAAPQTYFLGSSSSAIRVADVSGDGALDVVVAVSGAQSGVAVLLNLGNGTFGAVQDWNGGVGARDVVAAELDGDGVLDLALAGTDDHVRVLRGLGGGAFAPPAVVTPFALFGLGKIAAGDLDADGRPDLVALSSGGASVLRNLGNGSFAVPLFVVTGNWSQAHALADLDGDGDLDIATAVWGDNNVATNYSSVSIAWNSGAGQFPGPIAHPTMTQPSAIASGDLDGDGRSDVLVVNRTLNTMSVYRNLGTGSYAPQVTYSTGVQNGNAVALVDLDLDGDLDAVIAGSQVRIMINAGNGTFVQGASHPAGTLHSGIVVGDLNGDGLADVAVSAFSSSDVSVLLSTGAGTLAPAVSYPVGSSGAAVALGDLDGDGHLDLVVGNGNSNDVSILLNHGDGTFAPEVRHAAGIGPSSVVLADIDGDGDLDVSVVGQGGGLSVLMNQGQGTLALQVVYGTGLFTVRHIAADLDLDGDLDIAVTHHNGISRGVWVLWNDGGGTFSTHTMIETEGAAWGLALVDVDQDGDQDLGVTLLGHSRWVLLRNCMLSGATVCAGDGSLGACPCGNTSPTGSGSGCLSSIGLGGTLRGTGSASLAHDRLVLEGTQMPPGSMCVYFQGTSALAGGAGAAFGDGLRCAGGTASRLGIRQNVLGASQVPIAGGPSVSSVGGVQASGERVYQVWYRDTGSHCTAALFNLTNGLRVVWAP